jgi:transcriptional regulator GlxA family with amidase domain
MAYDPAALFARACELLDQNPTASLGRLAALVGVHRHTLAVVIRGHGAVLGFIAWRRQFRLSRAQALLREKPLLSLKEVAALVGATPATLDHVFHDLLGITPTKFRSVSAGRRSSRARPAKTKLARRTRKRPNR